MQMGKSDQAEEKGKADNGNIEPLALVKDGRSGDAGQRAGSRQLRDKFISPRALDRAKGRMDTVKVATTPSTGHSPGKTQRDECGLNVAGLGHERKVPDPRHPFRSGRLMVSIPGRK